MQQFVLDAMFKLFDDFHGAVAVDDEMGGKRIFSRADGPDVDVMKVFYALHPADDVSYL